ncbi:MAG: transglycosylase domain-containing protein, partial [Ilumatobacteraceae bacterium]
MVLAGALLITAVTVAVAPRLWGIANSHGELPTVLPGFEPLAQRSYVYDRSGAEIAIFERENVQPFALAQVPADVVGAVLAVEDNEFYGHDGVNVRSLIRATLSNFSSGATRQGASTITQQVVKNEFLAGLDRDGRYKLLQVHYALMLEKEMSKDDILERYLNTIFFGNNSYGLAAAAETYFGEKVEELTLVQGAFLAGLIRSPSGYDPFRKLERARARFEQVLSRLVDEKMITEPELENLLATWPIPEVPQVIAGRVTTPTYFTEALQDYLLGKSDILGDDEQERRSIMLRGGLRIHTTIDPSLQRKAEDARNALPNTAAGFDAAIVSLETATGAVRVMVGGKGFKRNVSEINMALVPRQTGSSIKFFILAAALQAGAQPNDLIEGTRPCVLPNPGLPSEPFVIDSGVSKGLSTLAVMTSASINCAYARLSQIVGLNRVVDTTYRMASSPYLFSGQTKSERGGVEPIQPFASFATGANEMSPLDMASGGQTIANVGLHHDPYFVESIERANGSPLYTHADAGTQVLDPAVALTAISVLKGVITNGTGSRYPLADGRPAAGKTGTQEDNTNSWFVGLTPELSTAVWVGNPNGYIPMVGIPEFLADGVDRVQGGTYPEEIWKLYTDAALAGTPNQDWPLPPPLVRDARRLYLPGVECLGQRVGGGRVTVSATTLPANPPEPVVPGERIEPVER